MEIHPTPLGMMKGGIVLLANTSLLRTANCQKSELHSEHSSSEEKISPTSLFHNMFAVAVT